MTLVFFGFQGVRAPYLINDHTDKAGRLCCQDRMTTEVPGVDMQEALHLSDDVP